MFPCIYPFPFKPVALPQRLNSIASIRHTPTQTNVCDPPLNSLKTKNRPSTASDTDSKIFPLLPNFKEKSAEGQF